MSELEEMGVPFSYASLVREIYFTVLPADRPDMWKHGDHNDGLIRVNCGPASREIMSRIILHELAHNVDVHEGISEDDDIVREKKSQAKFLPDSWALSSVMEYVAIGFEVFYCGTRKEKREMARRNPRLHATIKKIHRRHRAR